MRGPSARRLLPLVSVCVSELRGDLALLAQSGWDGFARRRADELLSALMDACDRQGLRQLAILFRSLRSLVALSPEEAGRLGRALDRKMNELLELAEDLVRHQLSRQRA